MRLISREVHIPFGIVVAASGLLALVAIFLPRSGTAHGVHLAGISGWSGGFGVAGAILLVGAAGLFLAAGWPGVPRFREPALTGAFAISVVAAAILIIRLLSIPHGAEAVAGSAVHYGPQIGIWFALVAGVAQLTCIAVFLGLRHRKDEYLHGAFPLSLAMIDDATSELDHALRTRSVPNIAAPADAASGLLAACSYVASRVRERRPRGASEQAWAELGAAAGVLRNAALLLLSLVDAKAGAQYEARAEACSVMLARGQEHLHRYLHLSDRGRRNKMLRRAASQPE